jgi:NitT/TauT family transport system substrate-binding protein
MSAVLEGGDVKLIAATKNQLAGKLMARPEINAIEDLRGKRIAASTRGSNTEYMAIQVLRRSGMEVGRDYSFVYAGGNQEIVAALSNDSAQATASVPPDDSRAAAAGAHELLDVTGLLLKYPATTVAASGKSIREKPEALRRLIASFKEAVQVYKNDPDTALRVISKYTKIDDLEFLRPAYELERRIMADDMRVDAEAINAAIEDIAADKPEIRQKTYADFVDERFLK